MTKLYRLQRGFTLIELVMVIILLGVLAIAILPRLTDKDAFSERGYRDSLASALRYAQKVAMTSGCKVQVVITESDYRLLQPATASDCSASVPTFTRPVWHPGKGSAYGERAPGEVTLSPATIIFQPSGATQNSTDISLHGNSSYLLRVHAVSGFTEIL